jgi:hypothetical protein
MEASCVAEGRATALNSILDLQNTVQTFCYFLLGDARAANAELEAWSTEGDPQDAPDIADSARAQQVACEILSSKLLEK